MLRLFRNWTLAPFHTGAEAAHGVAWLGPATVFPQPVGMAATWDPDLIERLGEATGRELRGKKAEDPSVGLNAWAPVVNPLRHPLWGRNEEASQRTRT
jgi:beta-glucosidase